jgi:hypothetical protein
MSNHRSNINWAGLSTADLVVRRLNARIQQQEPIAMHRVIAGSLRGAFNKGPHRTSLEAWRFSE